MDSPGTVGRNKHSAVPAIQLIDDISTAGNALHLFRPNETPPCHSAAARGGTPAPTRLAQ